MIPRQVETVYGATIARRRGGSNPGAAGWAPADAVIAQERVTALAAVRVAAKTAVVHSGAEGVQKARTVEVTAMRELLTVVTGKGQVTVPAEIRRALGIKEGDMVAFVVEGNQVRLVPKGSVVDRTAGIFRGRGRPLAAEELREVAEEAIAEECVERMGG